MRLFKVDAADSELFADKAANEKVQGFTGGWKCESIARPVQLETRRLCRNPNLAGRSLRADDDLSGIGFRDFDRQYSILEIDFNVVLINNRIQRSIDVIQCGVTVRAKLGFGDSHRQVLYVGVDIKLISSKDEIVKPLLIPSS